MGTVPAGYINRVNEVVPFARLDSVDVSSTQILDVRRAPHRDKIRNAVRYDPERLLATETLALPLDPKRRVVVYGDSDELVEAVVSRLRHSGFEAAVLEGGIESWRDNGLPLEDLPAFS